MKLSLQLKLSQGLAMTPQLQQAIRLLQLSSLELKDEIQGALDSNMMLELDEGNTNVTTATKNPAESNLNDAAHINNSPVSADTAVEAAPENFYEYSNSSGSNKNAESNAADAHADQDSATDTLRDHLLWQLNLTPISNDDAAIAIAIIDALDDGGYLSCDLEEIVATIKNTGAEVDSAQAEAVLHLIQSMGPAGIAARSLGECLLIQLNQCKQEHRWLAAAKQLVHHHLKLLAARDYAQIMRRMKLSQDELQEVIALVQSMNPRPGSQVNRAPTEYIRPDVFVRKQEGVWRVTLNPDIAPRLRINHHYAGMIKRANHSDDNTMLKMHLQEARWFIKSLQSRSETLLKVASCIVEKQRAFLEHGEHAMKPLVLHDIAERLDLHESTVSRVTTKKYIHTPRGIFELKYFFSSHVSTNFGSTCSSTAIRALMKKLIEAENTKKPLSDSKIAALFAEEGINIARRTVAKYRETIGIPPSNERKRLI